MPHSTCAELRLREGTEARSPHVRPYDRKEENQLQFNGINVKRGARCGQPRASAKECKMFAFLQFVDPACVI